MDILIEEFEDHDMSPFFVAGEEELASMCKQLHKLNAKEDHGNIHKADDIVRANNALEVKLVETADAFGRYNSVKIRSTTAKACLRCKPCSKHQQTKMSLQAETASKRAKFSSWNQVTSK
ncbi:unnamed protein product [Mucor hiemalis]